MSVGFFSPKKMSFTKIEADQTHVKLSNRIAFELNRSEISLRLNDSEDNYGSDYTEKED